MSVLVFAESVDGKFKKSTLEAVSYAKETATLLGTKTIAVSIGNVAEADLKALGNNGAEAVYAINLDKFTPEAYSAAIAEVAKKRKRTSCYYIKHLHRQISCPTCCCET
ncbi:hypothetical protein QQ054_17615 [Oscillatoria amoena NRMC-F 0135]|nr:hypothetical protein [Oscillatoria amoena NRMC-F 0135]